MPTKRRKRGPIRIGGRLSDRQRCILVAGTDFFRDDREPGVENDDHGRQLWQRYRAELMVDDVFNVATTPGRRPWGFWAFEAGPWQDRGESEAAVVHEHFADAAEKAEIEAIWLNRIGISLTHTTSFGAAREHAGYAYGVPRQFFDQHARRILAEQDAERERFYRGNGQAVAGA